ncbi:MAG: hypothetical protein KJZ47_08635 [Gemmatimonadales bacterium]|nr:hypothetical protein [Gemmatimonadales bacterium]
MRVSIKAVVIAVTFAAVVPVVGTAVPFSAVTHGAPPPECDVCKTHGFFGATVHHFGTGPTEYDCDAFNTCHPGDQIGSCSEYHFGCDEAMNFDRASDFDRIEHAIGTPHLAGLAELLARSPAVKVLEASGAIQVVDCNGSVIAHFPNSSGGATIVALD